MWAAPEGIIGKHLAERTFWFFASTFIFILFANWIGLIPGVGTIGWGDRTEHGFRIQQPLFRGANADLNLTLAMALVFFASWIVWAVGEVGVRGCVIGRTSSFRRNAYYETLCCPERACPLNPLKCWSGRTNGDTNIWEVKTCKVEEIIMRFYPPSVT